jgi:hypothetical protein
MVRLRTIATGARIHGEECDKASSRAYGIHSTSMFPLEITQDYSMPDKSGDFSPAVGADPTLPFRVASSAGE